MRPLDTIATPEARPAPSRGAGPSIPFSTVVKDHSRAAHVQAERAFQPFLQDPARHMPAFLSVQLAAHQALLVASPTVDPLARDLVAGLARDCTVVGGYRDAWPGPDALAPDGLHPLAVQYLIFGGRKGVAVIRRLMDRRPDLVAPSHFAADTAYDDAWQATLADLDRVAPHSPLADTILRDVAAGFAIFAQAAAACPDLTQKA